jgi:hypothetical protein
MTEIRNSQIENIKISEGVYVVDSKKFLDICEERTKDGVPSILSEGCKIRLELYKIAINEKGG